MSRRSFTLLELLAAVAVMGIVATMLIVALASAQADAKVARAQSQVSHLSQIVLSLYEERASSRIPIKFTSTPPRGYALRNVNNAALVRLTALREYLRFVLPDRRSDLLKTNANLQATLTKIGTSTPHVATVDMDFAGKHRVRYLTRLITLTHTSISNPPSGIQALGNYLAAALDSGWTSQHESAECLYLVLATSTIDGTSALDGIRSRDIQDTDGDGVPEIVDPWGNPIIWIRWPCGYVLTYAIRDEPDGSIRAAAIENKKTELGNDSLDILQQDFGYLDDPAVMTNNSYSIKPLVVSAGPDGEFDLLLAPSYLESSQVGYGGMRWPRNSNVFFPDPYCRQYANYDYKNDYNKYDSRVIDGLCGSYQDTNGDLEDQSVDNIFSEAP